MKESCFHCGQVIEDEDIVFQEKHFCCNGCKTVYEILNQNDLENFYSMNPDAGVKPDAKANLHFQFLDTQEIFDKIVDFSDDGVTVVTFHIPVIHCTSCIWLLESLRDINPNVIQSTVNFTQKDVQISYDSSKMSLSEVAILLTQLGYKPSVNLKSIDKKENKTDRSLFIKLTIAGFCFGNVMLLAFPEYLALLSGADEKWLAANKGFFRWMMFGLSLPVMFYSADVFFKSAWYGIKNKSVNVDLPISIGILVLFLRSVYDIIIDYSPGYFDSLCGLVFFMLIGRWFQQRTYKSMAFDRDYKSFYPIAITRIEGEIKNPILLSELKKGDRILIRNEEIIPADSILMKGEAMIDNSFVTGESKLIPKVAGDKIYAGGKQSGQAIELEVIKEVNQSYLTSLWNSSVFQKEESQLNALTNKISRYFIVIILFIAIASGIAWYFIDSSQILQVVTSILIVACPCALALSSPFILGNMMRIFAGKKFYVKNTSTIETMSKIDTIVFDKTGTITENESANIFYEGENLSDEEKKSIKSILKNSNHPLSRILYKQIDAEDSELVSKYEEVSGKGQKAKVRGKEIKLGSGSFVGFEDKSEINKTIVFVSIDGIIKGKYEFKNHYREGFKEMIENLNYYKLAILSGDNDSERNRLLEFFSSETDMRFNQSPNSKLEYIENLQKENKKVMMLGDGLNDSGALKQSDVGIAVSEDLNNFSPSCDAILDANHLKILSKYLKLSKTSMTLVWVAFTISFLYNTIGLSFAIAGILVPVVAAILMPISSISVVLFAIVSTKIAAKLAFKNLE